MAEYPLSVRLTGRRCVVVGAGAVGRRKVAGLLAAGARVRVVDPRAEALAELADVEAEQRPWRAEDVEGAFLVFAATDDRELNARIVAAARAAGALAQAVDDPRGGDFHLPAVLRRGDLTLAVSTGGLSPALAAAVRDRLAREYGPEWARVLEIAAALRQKRLTVAEEKSYNYNILRKLLAGGLAELAERGEPAAVEELLARVTGESICLEHLGIVLPKGLK
ncbi:precorrin-2 dehydrogenase/sirohydrochlorin ferrochelatase family protein [Geoalkalibacter sp.]|uniref:precorrin-2 dehydrogenase/sirohydrochlorin ferrochelatase family protein n=1 Tax=Geoalkalibacter sp. TaxID=3041440 RepID=UPI00272DF7A4|nr:bifunctional precorrin-2 dehydrogenase/sirohydrochlorin ferrochelatase [Geoalkalibacter sp.]